MVFTHLRHPVAFVKRYATMGEIGGAFADLSTWIPLVLAMSATGAVHFGTALLFAGVANLLVFVVYDLPIPVQPMHTISAVVVAQGLSSAEVAAAGVLVGGATLLLGVARAVSLASRVLPLALVRGVQLGVGLKLAAKGLSHKYLLHGELEEANGPVPGFVALFLLLLAMRIRNFPGALIVLAGAFLLAIAATPDILHALSFGPDPIQLLRPTAAEWRDASLSAALPQLPLTLLNSVIALSQLAADLYPDRGPQPAPVAAVATTVGVINLVCCPFGAVPSCHGSGGLAAQHAFGARSSVSMLLLGTLRVVCALLFGSSLQTFASAVSPAVLGAMLVAAGAQLAQCAWRVTSEQDVTVAVATAAGVLGLQNTGAGFLFGAAVAVAIYAAHIIAPAQVAGSRPVTAAAEEEGGRAALLPASDGPTARRRLKPWEFFETPTTA